MKINWALFSLTLVTGSVKIKISKTECFGIKELEAYNKMVTFNYMDEEAKTNIDGNQNLIYAGSCIHIFGEKYKKFSKKLNLK